MGVDDIEPAVVGHQKPSEAERPRDIGVASGQADGAHARRFQLISEVVLPRQDVGGGEIEPVGIEPARDFDEEPFRPARTEALGQPEHSGRHR